MSFNAGPWDMAHMVKAARKRRASLPCCPLKGAGFWTVRAWLALLFDEINPAIAWFRAVMDWARRVMGSGGAGGAGAG